MISQEAFFHGIREGLKLGAIYIVWSGFLAGGTKRADLRSLAAGSVVFFLLFLLLTMVGPGMAGRELSKGIAVYVFFLVFFSASIVLLKFPGIECLPRMEPLPFWTHTVVFSSSVIFLLPDALSASIYLADLASLQQSTVSVYVSIALGAIPVFTLLLLLSRRLPSGSVEYVGLPQLLILLVLIKLLLSGIPGVSGFSLVPTVQGGVMKFVHDIVHQSFLFLLVPDHPMLQTTVWNFIGFFFGPDLSIALALCILLLPSLYYLYVSITAPVIYPYDKETGADRRLVRASARKQRVRRAVPIGLFVVIVAMSWYSSGSEKGVSLYVPEPTPLIEEGGLLTVPLSSPGMDLMDGRIHKFTVLVDGRGVSLMMVRKPEGRLAVTLDACEICPPKGYGQRGGHVVCIYCMTPIPLDTLGSPGGCNPIPLAATVTEREVSISIEEIKSKWNALVNAQARGTG